MKRCCVCGTDVPDDTFHVNDWLCDPCYDIAYGDDENYDEDDYYDNGDDL